MPALDTIKYHFTNNIGLLYVVLSEFFYSFMNVSVKVLGSIDPPVTVLQLIAVRMIITYLFSLAYMSALRVPHLLLGPPKVRMLLFCRGFFGFFGLFGIYFSLQYLSLSDATVLTFLAPLCVAITSSILLHEPFTRKEAIAGVISLIGVVFIARPPFLFGGFDLGKAPGGVTTAQRMLAVGASLIGVVGTTGAFTSIRAIGMRAHAMHSMAYFSFHSVLVSSIGMMATQTPFIVPTRITWLLMLLLIGTFGFCAQLFMTIGLQKEKAGRASMGVYTQVIFALIFERIVFGTTPPWLSVFGTLLILGSAMYVAVTKEEPEEKKVIREWEDADAEQGEREALLGGRRA
ncbi:hypothetical protein AMATHDRAFT_7209 [Amanita thiersii Skay4041]|uniref:EamA domain-containing protein n=1 Tax=Amanita thiersii Skay4041 TaxID=703135 RepID=A0A2A9N8Y8_9AGAR|nr:hypothetical protein AMATHDRAFT_7209 [Amanita thiersii Skay4041]